jgi:hypothetical protein
LIDRSISLAFTQGAILALSGNALAHNAIFNQDGVHVISRALLSSKVRSDISKSRSVSSDRRSKTAETSKHASEFSRLRLIQALWHLSFVPDFASQLRAHTKIIRQLKTWSGEAVEASAEATPRGKEEPDAQTILASMGILETIFGKKGLCFHRSQPTLEHTSKLF